MGIKHINPIRGDNNSVINQIKEESALSHSLELTSQTAFGLMKIIRDLRRKLTQLEKDYRELKMNYATLLAAFKEREDEIDGHARRVTRDIIPALASLFIVMELVHWHIH